MELEGYESPFVGADPIDDGDDMELPPEWVEDTDAAPPENPEGVEDEGGEEAASPGEGEGVEGAPDTEEDPEGDEGAPDTEEDPEEDAPEIPNIGYPKHASIRRYRSAGWPSRSGRWRSRSWKHCAASWTGHPLPRTRALAKNRQLRTRAP